MTDQAGAKNRKAIRYKASWRIAIAVDGQLLREGRIKDISANGVGVLFSNNIMAGLPLTLHILVPALGAHEQKIIIVHAKTRSTVHDSSHHCFRVGISFEKFEMVADREFLAKRLETSHRELIFNP